LQDVKNFVAKNSQLFT